MSRWRRHHKQSIVDIEEAAQRANRCLQDAENFNMRAEKASEDLSETLRRNHFAEAVASAMQGA